MAQNLYSIFEQWRMMHVLENQQILYLWDENGTLITFDDQQKIDRVEGNYIYPVACPEQVSRIQAWIHNFSNVTLTVLYDPDKLLLHLKQIKVVNEKVPFYIEHHYSRYFHEKNFDERPFITLSFGSSLDGKIATFSGDSKYISGEETRTFVHHLRHEVDAIMVGRHTVEVDNPALTTRLGTVLDRSPSRVILDRHLSLSLHYDLFLTAKNVQTFVVCEKAANPSKLQALQSLGVHILQVDDLMSSQGMESLLRLLKHKGINRLLIEGGGTVHFSFIKWNLFDELFAQISPLLIGGKDAKTAVEGKGFAQLKNAKRVAYKRYFQLGEDIIIYAVNQTHFLKDYYD